MSNRHYMQPRQASYQPEQGNKFTQQPAGYDQPQRTIPYGNQGMVAPYSRLSATQHLDEERRAVIKHLERLIERERGHGLQLQEQYQEEIHQIRVKVAGTTEKIEAQKQHLEAQQEEGRLLHEEQVDVDGKIRDVLNKKSTIQRQMNERMDQSQKQLTEIERRFTVELNQVQTDHFAQLRELDLEWGQKCDEMMDRNRQIDDYNQETQRKILEIKDSIHSFNQDSHGKTFDLVQKVKKLILAEFKEKLNVMESQINKLDEDRLRISRSNKDTLTDAQKNLRELVESYEYMLKDKVRLVLENQQASLRNKQYEHHNASVGLEIKHKDSLQSLLSRELDLLKVKNEKVNNEDRDQTNKIVQHHSIQQNKHSKEIQDLRQRADAITKSIQENELSNSRLNGDVGRLTELLQANASKVIYQTFAENKFI